MGVAGRLGRGGDPGKVGWIVRDHLHAAPGARNAVERQPHLPRMTGLAGRSAGYLFRSAERHILAARGDLSSIRGMHLTHDILQMHFHRTFRDAERICDYFVRLAAAQVANDLFLADGQLSPGHTGCRQTGCC